MVLVTRCQIAHEFDLNPSLLAKPTPRTVDPKRLTLPLVIFNKMSPVDVYTIYDDKPSHKYNAVGAFNPTFI